ncbi:MAG: hypothetical protein A3G18_01035 [Rhodospirillales bacterium RIFCSPLOWO2_12_FULL_58_28]|nr:MAG: hypothetical protein A3G18_01035 [Rhodospirillales bacterium RIFCSPLOWO2_12_FULL_58_28]
MGRLNLGSATAIYQAKAGNGASVVIGRLNMSGESNITEWTGYHPFNDRMIECCLILGKL